MGVLATCDICGCKAEMVGSGWGSLEPPHGWAFHDDPLSGSAVLHSEETFSGLACGSCHTRIRAACDAAASEVIAAIRMERASGGAPDSDASPGLG